MHFQLSVYHMHSIGVTHTHTHTHTLAHWLQGKGHKNAEDGIWSLKSILSWAVPSGLCTGTPLSITTHNVTTTTTTTTTTTITTHLLLLLLLIYLLLLRSWQQSQSHSTSCLQFPYWSCSLRKSDSLTVLNYCYITLIITIIFCLVYIGISLHVYL